jgi:ParB/RepB/Spo0J family partition protein
MNKSLVYERLKEIPIERIEVFIPRDRDPEIRKRLVESIKNSGLIMPITVIQKHDGTYRLVKGQGRIIAHKDLKIQNIRAFVFLEGELTEKEIIQNWLVENEVRERMSDVDKTRLMKAELEITKSITDVAEKFGMQPTTIKQYIKTLEETTPEVIEMVEKNEISWTKTKEITGASKDKETQKAVAKIVASDKLNIEDTRTVIRKAKELEKKKITVTIPELRSGLRKMNEELKSLRPAVGALKKRLDLITYCIITLLKDKSFRSLLTNEGVQISPELLVLIKRR